MSNLDLNQELMRFSPSSSDILTIGEACEGIAVFGQTGAGKTSAVKTLVRAMLKSGMGGVVICVKPQEFEDWQKLVSETGRSADFVNFSPGLQAYNFLSQEAAAYDTVPVENLVTVLLDAANVIDGKIKDDIWSKAAKALLRSLITIIYCAKKRIDITDLYDCMAGMPRGLDKSAQEHWVKDSPLYRILQQVNTPHPDLEASMNYVAKEWPQLDAKQSSSIQMTLGTLLDVLRRSPLRELLCGETTVTPADCRKGKIIFLNLPINTMSEVGRVAQIIFKAAAQRTFQRVTGNPVFIFSDECQYVASPQDTLFNSTARGYQCVTVYMTQNLPLWYEQAGDNSKNRILGLLGNLTTKIFFLNGDRETNEFASDLIGKTIVRMKSSNQSSGGLLSGVSSSSSTGYSEQQDHLVRPEEFKKLKWGTKKNDYVVEGIVYKTGRQWSTGKVFLRAKFDQKIGDPLRQSLPFWIRAGAALIVAGMMSGAELFQIVPSASYWIAQIQPRNQQEYDFLEFILTYGFWIFPVLTGMGMLFLAGWINPVYAQDKPKFQLDKS